MRGIFSICAAMVMAGSAAAQDWTVSTTLDRGWFWGRVSSSDDRMNIRCSGSLPGADPMYGAESAPHTPYTFTIEMAYREIVATDAHTGNAATRDDVIVVSNAQGYQLPDVRYNMLNGERWQSAISVADPLVVSLMAGGGLHLWAQDRQVTQYGAAGLADGLATAIRHCDDHWTQAGHPLPDHARDVVMTLRGQSGNGTGGAAPLQPSGPSMEQAALDAVTDQCAGPGQVRADFIFRSDFDGDGLEDIVLDWRGVSCQQGTFANSRGAGHCGMHNCLVSVFVSSSIAGGARPWETLAMDAQPAEDTPAQLVVGRSPSACSGLGLAAGCGQRFAWNGSDFVPAN